MVSILLEADDYKFLSGLAEADKEDLSTAVLDLLFGGADSWPWSGIAKEGFPEQGGRGGGVSVSEMMDLLAEHGITADLRLEDYRRVSRPFGRFGDCPDLYRRSPAAQERQIPRGAPAVRPLLPVGGAPAPCLPLIASRRDLEGEVFGIRCTFISSYLTV